MYYVCATTPNGFNYFLVKGWAKSFNYWMRYRIRHINGFKTIGAAKHSFKAICDWESEYAEPSYVTQIVDDDMNVIETLDYAEDVGDAWHSDIKLVWKEGDKVG